MRTPAGFAIALLIAGGLFAQNRSGFVNTGGGVVRTTGSVVFPGGSSALPGVQRTAGSVVYPGGGTQVGVPAGGVIVPGARLGNGSGQGFHNGFGPGRQVGRGNNRDNRGGSPVVGYYPVYVGGGSYDPSYYENGYGNQAPSQQQQPNVVVVYPQQPPPVIINQLSPGDSPYGGAMAPVPNGGYPAPIQSQTSEPPSAQESAHFLIAFKDHTIYSAVAYWVEGDTLHYFTDGSTHNQVSVSLIDRDLTARLNKDSGVEVKLPAVR